VRYVVLSLHLHLPLPTIDLGQTWFFVFCLHDCIFISDCVVSSWCCVRQSGIYSSLLGDVGLPSHSSDMDLFISCFAPPAIFLRVLFFVTSQLQAHSSFQPAERRQLHEKI
jgi:hypothetical protein